MRDVPSRIADLSPERRKALEAMLKSAPVPAPDSEDRGSANATGPGSAAADWPSIDSNDYYGSASDAATAKARTSRFYDAISNQLAATEAGRYSYFLNFGYVPDGSPEYATVQLPEHYLNKNCVRLVLEVVGDCDIRGRRILDVGSGRGGTLYVLAKFFEPAALVGVELSLRAASFCRKAHRDPRTRFLNGDAEALPFRSDSFDVVTNIESSHSYPDIRTFYAEVHRVLAPGGYFLYTDLMPAPFVREYLGSLLDLGFDLERDRDITRNVLRSCDEIARVHLSSFDGGDQRVMNDFAGTPSSSVYDNMQAGRSTYRLLKLRKRVGPSAHSAV